MIRMIVCLVLLVPISASEDANPRDVKRDVSITDQYVTKGFDWLGDRFLGLVETFIPDQRTGRAGGVEGRKRKKLKLNKYVFPLIIGFLLIKSVILPLALKALAILSGKAVVLSLMSLILAAIIGLRTMANNNSIPAQSKIDLVNLPLTKYRRKDVLDHADQIEDDPYRYYAERRRKRRK